MLRATTHTHLLSLVRVAPFASRASRATSCLPTLVIRHFATRYGQPYRPRRNWQKIIFLTLGGLSITGFGLWWGYWPHHTFSSSVAKILRKGLWAESERGNYDYQTALKLYLEALEQAYKEDLDILSDEYTGIQLKVGEMYERLNMNQDALMIYSEIAGAYLDALTSNKVPVDLRPHLIQKDLRVVIKMVELNRNNTNASKMLLMTHFLVAQEEVARRSPYASSFINVERAQLVDDINGETNATFDYSQAPGSSAALQQSKDGIPVIPKNREAWEPFRDELFNARDLYVAICLASGDLTSAVRAKIATTSWMLNADCNPGDILMSQTNMGSVLYLQAEEFEAKEIRALKMKKYEEIQTVKISKEQCIKLATDCYESVLEFSKKLSADLRRDENVEESIALSTYGLGVIKLHLGELNAAKNLLRESRLRAKGSGFSDLVVEAERELHRLETEFNEIAQRPPQDKETDRINQLIEQADAQPNIELDVQLVKHR